MLSVHRLTAGAGYQYMMRGDTLTLPSTYVQESVELAYATTVRRAQGATVETAHLLVTEQLTRALLYVGMTRGRHTNMAYVATHQSTTDLHEPHPEQTMQDVLETVLQDPGVELSAHEVMRRELDNATRLDRLIPIHEHLCQLDARTRYRAAAAHSGLSTSDQAALEASPAYCDLVAELRRAEAAGLRPADILHRAVNQASVNDTNDIAAVLHARVERLVTKSINRTGRQPVLIAGLVTPATNITDPNLIAPLQELEAQITQRADHLGRQAADDAVAWHAELSRWTDSSSETVASLAREIASYRELYQVHGPAILGMQPTSLDGPLRVTRYQRLKMHLAEVTTMPAEDFAVPTAISSPSTDCDRARRVEI